MNISKKVERAQKRGLLPEASMEEALILKDICDKYKADPHHVEILLLAVMALGFGRNEETSGALRALADFIHSPIECAETLEAKLDGKLL